MSTWRQRIDPVLREEEDRSAFDIHDYGSRILQQLETLTLDPSASTTAAAGDVLQEQQLQEQQAEGKQQRGKKGSSSAAQAAAAGDGPAFEFKEVVQCGDSFDVCRMFAAMLQLINNRWVCGPNVCSRIYAIEVKAHTLNIHEETGNVPAYRVLCSSVPSAVGAVENTAMPAILNDLGAGCCFVHSCIKL